MPSQDDDHEASQPATPTTTKPVSFKKLMSLKRLDANTFESLSPAWAPSSAPQYNNRAFGGHVYAQSAWAASQTVDSGFTIHNVTGHFVLPGLITVPFTYHVKRIRDGSGYCLRHVEAYQLASNNNKSVAVATDDNRKTPCFISTISFKREEKVQEETKTAVYAHQNAPRNHIKQTYASVLDGKLPTDHTIAPAADTDWWDPNLNPEWAGYAETHPGCEHRKVDMSKYNGVPEEGGGKDGRIVSGWRQLLFYRIYLDDDEDDDDEDDNKIDDRTNLNLHACAHLYTSDRNGLFIVQRALGYGRYSPQIGSLSHTVIFHGSSRGYRMTTEQNRTKWFVQEAWTSNSGANRICHDSRLWDFEAGKIIGTTVQDGMMRVRIENKEEETSLDGRSGEQGEAGESLRTSKL